MKNIYEHLITKYGKENYESNLYSLYENLQDQVRNLEHRYSGALLDIKRLEEENIETSNLLYELQNSIEAVDNRIDILYGEANG